MEILHGPSSSKPQSVFLFPRLCDKVCKLRGHAAEAACDYAVHTLPLFGGVRAFTHDGIHPECLEMTAWEQVGGPGKLCRNGVAKYWQNCTLSAPPPPGNCQGLWYQPSCPHGKLSGSPVPTDLSGDSFPCWHVPHMVLLSSACFRPCLDGPFVHMPPPPGHGGDATAEDACPHRHQWSADTTAPTVAHAIYRDMGRPRPWLVLALWPGFASVRWCKGGNMKEY